MFSIYVVWNWSFHQTLHHDLKLRQLVWYSDSVCVRKKPLSFAHCVEVPMMRNSVLFAFSFNLLFFIQRETSWRQSLSWFRWATSIRCGQRNRFMCHLHKGDDPSCDSGYESLVVLYTEWKATAPKQNPGGHHKRCAACLRSSYLF